MVRLGALVVLALGLRVWGIGFGLPALYHPDEPAYVLQALAVGSGLPNGLTFANPPGYKYVLLGEYGITYILGRIAGAYASPRDLIEQFRVDPTQLYLIARVTSAVFGAGTMIVASVIARQLRGLRAAALAGWFCAVALLLVRDAHFGVNDTLATLLASLALLFSVRVAQCGSTREYVVAGAFSGLAFAAKYQAGLVVTSLVAAHLLRRGHRRQRDFMAAGAATLVMALVAFPSLVLEPGRVIQDIDLHLIQPARSGYDGMDPAGGYLYYLKVLVWGLGLPLTLAAVAGLVLACVRLRSGWLVLASWPVLLYAVLGGQRMYFARFLLPALPALIVLAALSLDELLARRSPAMVMSVVLLIGLPTLLDSLRLDVLLTREDTRRQAQAWLQVHARGTASAEADDVVDLDTYRREGVEYLVSTSFRSELTRIDPASEARRLAFNAALSREGELVAQFRPYAGEVAPAFVYDQIYAPITQLGELERPGPSVAIYRLRMISNSP